MVSVPMGAREDSSEAPPHDGARRRWRWAWLAGLSAVALLVLAGLAVLVTTDDDSPVSSDDVAAAIAVVTQHNDAQNAADGDVMRATTTDDAIYGSEPDEPGDEGLTLDQYINMVEGYGPVQQTVTGEPTVVRDPAGSGRLHASVPMRFDLIGGARNGTMVYMVREVDGEWKIARLERLL